MCLPCVSIDGLIICIDITKYILDIILLEILSFFTCVSGRRRGSVWFMLFNYLAENVLLRKKELVDTEVNSFLFLPVVSMKFQSYSGSE